MTGFIGVVCEKFFLGSARIWSPKNDEKNVLVDNHYNTIYEPVRIRDSSATVM